MNTDSRLTLWVYLGEVMKGQVYGWAVIVCRSFNAASILFHIATKC